MHRLSRATALKIAAILSFLTGVWVMVDALAYLPRGAADIDQMVDSPPYFIIVLAFVLAVVKIIAAYSTWQGTRWGVIATLLVNSLDTVAGVPGILFAPTLYLQIGSIIMTILGIAVIVLCLWRDRKPVMA